MSLIPSFTLAQDAITKIVSLVDTTDYTSQAKNTVAARRLYLYKRDGIEMPFTGTPSFSYITYPNDTITIGVDRDYCLRIRLELQVGSVTYTGESIVALTAYADEFFRSLAQGIAANDAVLTTAYFDNLQQAYTEKDNALLAASYNMQYEGQNALDRLKSIADNKNNLF